MIIFKTIRWKNFLSTGDQWTEINFQHSDTNLIIGTNGAGKSTMLDALTFSLFNKPFRKINKSQLINATNERDCLVEVVFDLNGREYLVRRGIKPNIFEIDVDGTVMNKQADDRSMQKILEETILKVNYKSFTQIVILGSSTFVPFMQLSGSNRRDVIEDLLDIRIFSAMNHLIKEKMREQREKIKSLTFKKDNVKDKIQMQKSFIKELEDQGKNSITENEKKKDSLSDEISVLIMKTEGLEDSVYGLTEQQKELIGTGEKLLKLNNLKGKLSQKVSTITKEHKFFSDNVTCPTCTQSIEESFRLNKINEAESKAKELKKGYEELESAIKLEEEREQTFKILTSEATKLTHEISKTNTRISGLENQSRDLEQEIQTITEQLKNRTAEKHALETLLSQLEDLQKEQSEFKEKNAYHEFAHSLMKDGGVKSKIIKRYLPLMNQQINKYLQLMDFYINFSLDEEFKESIKSPVHEDFSYESFSEGEKMRIDLSLLFTWRDIAKMKNSVSTNLLILDEIFDSSLDGFGTDYFTRIIKYVVTDANVFVISHKTDELVDKFDNILKFDKIKGFSKLTS